jgi:cyclic dehypoxanthinyl futalosine synthase
MDRISATRAKELHENETLHKLGEIAHSIRLHFHNDKKVTYISDRNINYTNICVSGCRFCAFRIAPGAEGGYILSDEEIHKKIDEAEKAGATQILLQGGMHPDLKISYYEEMISNIKKNFNIHLHAFSPPEIIHIGKVSDLTIIEILNKLQNAGLDSIPGGGAEILSDEIRKQVSPHKCTSDEWIEVMKQAHSLGMRTTATMMFGMGEKIEHRIEHLERIRSLQDQTGGFTAFIPWTFQPYNTKLSHVEPASAVEYLKMLALSRIFLDNFENIQASWVTQGEKIGQLALFFGANDMGGTMMEENVVRAAGCENRLPEKRLREIIEKAGFIPKKRNTLYQVIEN